MRVMWDLGLVDYNVESVLKKGIGLHVISMFSCWINESYARA